MLQLLHILATVTGPLAVPGSSSTDMEQITERPTEEVLEYSLDICIKPNRGRCS